MDSKTFDSLKKPSPQDILEARHRIAPYAHRTPLFTCRTVDSMVGGELFFKCENLQKVGAFKFRGACNAVFSLTPDEAVKGVATHSSGNHAQALAAAARLRDIPAYIVMPETAPKVKIAAVRGYGAEIVFCEPTLAAREETLEQVVARTGAVFVHPYNDVKVIAGQATCAAELLEEEPGLDMLVTPVGGGGLLSGTALSARYFGSLVDSDTEKEYAASSPYVIAAEPAGADDACRSFNTRVLVPSENPKTIADGLLTSLGSITFPLVLELVSDIVLANEEYIVKAMRLVWERMKLVIEPSAAVPLAAILEGNLDVKGKRAGIIISGGNVDLDRLPW